MPSLNLLETSVKNKCSLAASRSIEYADVCKRHSEERTTRPVVLASLDWLRRGDPPFALGVASIASSLRAAGVDNHWC